MNVTRKSLATPLRRVVRTVQLEDGQFYDVLECGHNETGQYSGKRRRCRTCADPKFELRLPREATAHLAEDATPASAPMMEATTAPSSPAPMVYTAAEVAVLLRIDVKTVYEAARRGEIPGSFHVGRSLRFSRAALASWLNRVGS